MKKIIFAILSICLWCTAFCMPGENPVYFSIDRQGIEFDRLFFEDQYDLFSVEEIIADVHGFMWFVTKEGLYRYDGRHFVVMGTDHNGNSYFEGEILLSGFLKDDQLWIGGSHQIFAINTRDLTIKSYKTPLDNEPGIGNIIRGTIHVDKQGIVYAGYWSGGLIILDPSTGEISHYYSKKPENGIPCKTNTITDIKPRNDSTIWITSHDGLFIFDLNIRSFTPFITNGKDDRRESGQFNCFLQSLDGSLWLGSNNGLLRTDPDGGNKKQYYFDQAPIEIFERNIVESLTETGDGLIWVGTRYGLYRMDPVTENFDAYYHDKTDPRTIHNNYVRRVFADKKDLIWIGHHFGAVSLLPARKKQFVSYQLISDYIAEQRVHSVFSEDDKLWFGTEAGLYIFSKTAGTLVNFRHEPDNPHSLSQDFVSGILKDQNGLYWISTDKGGINRFDLKTGKFQNIISGSHAFASYSQSDIWTIYLDNRRILWSGTGGDGLIAYNTVTGELIRYMSEEGNDNTLSSNFVGPVIRGGDGTLWVGTSGGGLNYFIPGSTEINHIGFEPGKEQSLSANKIISLCLTPDDKLYIGSTSGIDILDIPTGEISQFKFNHKLPSKRVQSIVLDHAGNFWIATRRGLVKYEPINNTYQIFTKSDGLSNNDFLPGAFYQSENGEIFLGTQNGATGFFPWNIHKNRTPPPIVITDILISGKSQIHNPDVKGKFSKGQMVFPFTENNITFHFAALDFNEPGKNQVYYMLEGYDARWMEDINNGLVNYSNLPPGSYSFKVIGSNNDNVWNNDGAIFAITITPPFWDTLWFKTGLFLIIVTSVFLIIRLQTSKVKRQKEELERLVSIRTAELYAQNEKIEKKNIFLENQKNAIEHQAMLLTTINRELEEQKLAIKNQAEELKEMDRIKNRFFASISHEFRTPLTLILNSVSLMKSNSDPDDENNSDTIFKLSIIKKNASRLHRLIDQLLDLVKIESGFMKLGVSEGNTDEIIQSIAQVFSLKADTENIRFRSIIRFGEKTAFLDWDKVEKILYNLLSNALKFTSSAGMVVLRASDYTDEENKRFIKVEISDTGCGITPEQQTRVFSMFYRGEHADQHHSGTGIGLALAKQLALIHKGDIRLVSEPGKGSLFTLNLPACKESYSDNEIDTGGRESTSWKDIIDDNPDFHPCEEINKNTHEMPKLLFVDDNRDLGLLMQQQLKGIFNVEFAPDAIEGLEKSLSSYPDIIVSDLVMPGISGIEFCKRIKEDIRTEHLPFILLTAKLDKHSELEALSSQADDYITKPFSIDALTIKLKNQIAIRKQIENKLRKELDSPTRPVSQPYSNRFLNAATKIINDHIDEPDFGVDNLAYHLNMSRTQLYRKSEKIFGMSANNFIKKVRLNKSYELLKDGELNISEVAYKTGFKTPGYFSKCFENQFGVLPSKFIIKIDDEIDTKQ